MFDNPPASSAADGPAAAAACDVQSSLDDGYAVAVVTRTDVTNRWTSPPGVASKVVVLDEDRGQR